MAKTRKDKLKVASAAHVAASANGRIVLVGTYKGDQLTTWRGWYNYPISDDDKIGVEDAANHPETNVINDDTTLEAA